MGDVQRIFYFHVASKMGFLAFVTFVAGIVYLTRADRRWDIVAHASACLRWGSLKPSR